MKEYPVTIRSKLNVPSRFREAVVACELELATNSTLKTLPGSHHWHVRRAGETGTLEATWLPAEGRFWFAVHENRNGAWIEPAVEQLRQRLQEE